jgi:hypothetical protein
LCGNDEIIEINLPAATAENLISDGKGKIEK